VKTLERWLEQVKYGVPSIDPEDPRFEPLRYWRGPVWIIINWMISNGLRHYG
jgi:glycogen debranching enzyme